MQYTQTLTPSYIASNLLSRFWFYTSKSLIVIKISQTIFPPSSKLENLTLSMVVCIWNKSSMSKAHQTIPQQDQAQMVDKKYMQSSLPG